MLENGVRRREHAPLVRLLILVIDFPMLSADWLTGDWLDEQLRGQRELSGMINTFATFRRDYESLADWMFSEQLLKA